VKLLVGLGNPGARYAGTRHNVGVLVVERFSARAGIALDARRFQGRFGRGHVAGHEVALLLPETFMNRSGEAVADALEALPGLDAGTDLLVIFDDLDLPFARLRMRRAGGAGGQRGLEDVIQQLASQAFPRLRVGIGRPPPGVDPVDWVLSPFDPGEQDALPQALDAACEALEDFVRDGVEMAMQRANRLSSPADPEDEPPA